MKPHFADYLEVFQRYKIAGKAFYAIHLSDEHGSDPVYWYADCKHVYRPYITAKVAGMSNVTIMPLGPYRNTNDNRDLCQRRLAWSFYGTGWMDREAKMEELKKIAPNSFTFYKSWLDAEQLKKESYSETCLNSLFMPCPPGQSVETFRFYEALDHGCIPLYVREGKDDDLHFKFLGTHLPLVVIDSWADVGKVVAVFLQKPELLVEYRSKLLVAWSNWKDELKKTLSNL